MKLVVSSALCLTLALALGVQKSHASGPPPPSARLGTSFDMMSELSTFEGVWSGIGIYSSSSNILQSVATLRITRPPERDFLVFELLDDRGNLREYAIISYNPTTADYEVYYPGYGGIFSEQVDRRVAEVIFSDHRSLEWKYPRLSPNGWQHYNLIKVTDELVTLTISNVSTQGETTSTEVYTLEPVDH